MVKCWDRKQGRIEGRNELWLEIECKSGKCQKCFQHLGSCYRWALLAYLLDSSYVVGVTDATITVCCKRDVRKKYHHSILSCVGIMKFLRTYSRSVLSGTCFFARKVLLFKEKITSSFTRQIGSWHHISCLLITIQWMIVED